MRAIDGFYAAYIAGQAGEGMILLIFKGKDVVGCDLCGFKFDGRCVPDNNKSSYLVHVHVTAPPNRDTIQGQNTGPNGLQYELNFEIPEEFESLPFISIVTPFGPVNLRLEKVRDLGVLFN